MVIIHPGKVDMDEIHVNDGEKVLTRVVTDAALVGLAPLTERYGSVYMVYDSHLESLVTERVEPVLEMSDMFRERYRGKFSLIASEAAKDMDSVLSICRWLLVNDADRDSLLLAVGGGITTDMAGFAASVYKRGMRFGYVPTTLLAQVDASLGGKTGVNMDGYKNVLGVIRQPDFVFICPEFLETLPYRDFLSGASELLKTFIIDDRDKYEKAVRILSDIAREGGKEDSVRARLDGIMELVHASAAVKARIVSGDMLDFGERRKLNLGHTFAHAIEYCARNSGADITHGEAVAMGVVMAAGMSEKAGLCESGLEEKVRKDFADCGLPVDCPFSMDMLSEAMSKDKKRMGGELNLVLIKELGEVVVSRGVAF